jgi:hypothetical protein
MPAAALAPTVLAGGSIAMTGSGMPTARRTVTGVPADATGPTTT